jgi:hypothetical protein|tara:strand:+ start:1411 stop:1878 length:468 start_codon:yes stop_codon:yes gene_type:complete
MKILIPILIFLLLVPTVAAVVVANDEMPIPYPDDVVCYEDADCTDAYTECIVSQNRCDYLTFLYSDSKVMLDDYCSRIEYDSFGICEGYNVVQECPECSDCPERQECLQCSVCPKPDIGFFILLGAGIGVLAGVPLFIAIRNFLDRLEKRKKKKK